MSNPFPGMNPYLEKRSLWSGSLRLRNSLTTRYLTRVPTSVGGESAGTRVRDRGGSVSKNTGLTGRERLGEFLGKSPGLLKIGSPKRITILSSHPVVNDRSAENRFSEPEEDAPSARCLIASHWTRLAER